MVSPDERNPETAAKRRTSQRRGLRIDLSKAAPAQSGLNVPI